MEHYTRRYHHPELYNYTLNEYSRKDISEKAWNEVAKQVGMTVVECKDRWKNLRAVFVRHMKPGPSGSASKNKKPYYLTEAMKFVIPYIKAIGKASGNLPDLTQPDDDVHSSASDDDGNGTISGQSVESASLHEPSQPLSTAPNPQKPSLRTTTSTKPQHESTTEKHTEPVSKNVKKRVARPNDVDSSLIEYFQAKKAKLLSAEQGDLTNTSRREALKMFLLSMLPDVESMTEVQVRQFKRKCLQAIDDILLPPPPFSPASTSFHSVSPCPSDHSIIFRPPSQLTQLSEFSYETPTTSSSQPHPAKQYYETLHTALHDVYGASLGSQ